MVSTWSVKPGRSLCGSRRTCARVVRGHSLRCPGLEYSKLANYFTNRVLKYNFRKERRKSVVVKAKLWGGGGATDGGDWEKKLKTLAEQYGDSAAAAAAAERSKSRKEVLVEYVNGLWPDWERVMEEFELPSSSIVAIRQTVNNLIGTLPPQYFEITISSREENLAQLMYSVLMTGYMFCNAFHRLELSKRLDLASPRGGSYVPASLSSGRRAFMPDVTSVVKKKEQDSFDCTDSNVKDTHGDKEQGSEDEELDYVGQDVGVYAAGTQKVDISGDVLRWHYEHGVQQLSAAEYIEQLEEEVAALRREVALSQEKNAAGSEVGRFDIGESDPASVIEREAMESEILAYLKTLSSDTVSELTECASADVMEAMNALVERLIGREDKSGVWSSNRSECTSTELAQILCWLMAVGHRLRDMEIRLSLTTSLQAMPGMTYGPDDGAEEYPSSSFPKLPPGK